MDEVQNWITSRALRRIVHDHRSELDGRIEKTIRPYLLAGEIRAKAAIAELTKSDRWSTQKRVQQDWPVPAAIWDIDGTGGHFSLLNDNVGNAHKAGFSRVDCTGLSFERDAVLRILEIDPSPTQRHLMAANGAEMAREAGTIASMIARTPSHWSGKILLRKPFADEMAELIREGKASSRHAAACKLAPDCYKNIQALSEEAAVKSLTETYNKLYTPDGHPLNQHTSTPSR